jgi:hypothetical protein
VGADTTRVAWTATSGSREDEPLEDHAKELCLRNLLTLSLSRRGVLRLGSLKGDLRLTTHVNKLLYRVTKLYSPTQNL